jgi:hypothetical protein
LEFVSWLTSQITAARASTSGPLRRSHALRAHKGDVFTPASMVEAMLDLVKDFHLLVRLNVFNTKR